MSATAIVLPMLAERDLLQSPVGRDGFAVLLFQDLAFIPLVALAPLLASGVAMPNHVPWIGVAKGVAAIAAILIGGRFLLPPLFRTIGGAKTPEVFTATALAIVAGTAFIAEKAGLSPSLGAFMAGVLLSESEYRHELQADISPFEGLLLGFFFISVGMGADLTLARHHPGLLIASTAAIFGAKTAIAFGLAIVRRKDATAAVRFALALPQASEFSFVLFGAATAAGALAAEYAAMATLASAASMIATPIVFAASEKFLIPHLEREKPIEFDTIDAHDNPVILCGFGRVGQIVGRVLRMHDIPFTALERDAGQVDVIRRFGAKVYFGDPTRLDVLRAAGIEQAKLLVVVLDSMEDVLRTVDTAKRHFPNVKILARARNRRHAHLLMDRGVADLVRDTFHSSLKLAERALTEIGIEPNAAARAVKLFQEHDEQNLLAAHAIYSDEKQLIQNTQQATEELASLFEADR